MNPRECDEQLKALGAYPEPIDMAEFVKRLLAGPHILPQQPKPKNYKIMGYKCPVCDIYNSLPCRCDCGRRMRRVRE